MAGKVMRRALAALVLACAAAATALAAAPVVPVPGMVTLVDLGAAYCPPCRAMGPALEQVQREYKGRAAVVLVDVTKDSALATRLGTKVIPTQIFYDKSGREVARHIGILDKKALAGQLDKLLAQ